MPMTKHNETSVEEFNVWLKKSEGLNLEFKTAKNSYSANKDLPDYCAALANEGGGKLVLGVNPAHQIIGTNAFQNNSNRLSNDLLSKLKIRINVEELHHPQGRILIFHVTSHPPGQPVRSTGNYAYPMRAGESLVEMDAMTLKRILNETQPDFSNLILEGLSIADMDRTALENFRKWWIQKSQRPDYLKFSEEKIVAEYRTMFRSWAQLCSVDPLRQKRNDRPIVAGK